MEAAVDYRGQDDMKRRSRERRLAWRIHSVAAFESVGTVSTPAAEVEVARGEDSFMLHVATATGEAAVELPLSVIPALRAFLESAA